MTLLQVCSITTVSYLRFDRSGKSFLKKKKEAPPAKIPTTQKVAQAKKG
jgi:hypothetical protein